MTEDQQLKENAEKQYREQRLAELDAYMTKLANRCHEAFKKSLWSGLYVLVAFIVMIGLSFVNDIIGTVAMVIYFGILAYSIYTDRVVAKCMGELEGAARVLKILGLSDIDWDELGKTRRRRVWSSMVDTVKGWSIKKQKAREEAYKPA